MDTDEWTVRRHLDGRPAGIVALYHRSIELAELDDDVGRGDHLTG
ncbi:hypothetical protein [Dactylosporangium sp. NPDC005555]